jgi:hypothetical protein
VLQKKYRKLLCNQKVIVGFFLLFFYSAVRAQVDTTDPVLKDTIELPTEKTHVHGDDEIKEDKYFSEKNQYEDAVDSFQMRTLPISVIKKMQDDDDYWYANAELKKAKSKKQDAEYIPISKRNWFQTILWLIIIASFAGFIIWWLADSNVSLFRKKAKAVKGDADGGVAMEDIFAINYQQEIDRAARQENYRLAIRLMFLRLLKNLSERNIIQYDQVKTNLDYLSQLQPTRYYKDFFRITRNYEYSWYGHFEINEQAYRIIRKDFDNFDRYLN